MPQTRCPRCRYAVSYLEDMRGELSCPACGEPLSTSQAAKATAAPPAARYEADQDDSGWNEPPAGGKRRTTTITLRGRNQEVTESLPPLCMCCGDEATTFAEKKFGWYPPWICLLAPLGGLPFFIVLLLLRKMMKVRIPLCPRHRHPWLGQHLLLGATLLYLLVLPWFVILLSVALEKSLGRGNVWSVGALLGWFLGMPVLLVLALVVRRRTIHPKKITDVSITLGGVSEAFVEGQRAPARGWF